MATPQSNRKPTGPHGDTWQGFWRLADPKISLTSAAAICIGAPVAAVDSRLSWTWLAVTGLALFCMEVAKNAWGDVYDYDSGTDLAVAPEDRTPFSGGKRVLVDELLTRGQTWAMAIGFGSAGVALGAAIVFLREPQALWIGMAGLALGWSYHGPPLRLAYRGLGELDVLVCYGPIIVLSVYLIQAGELSWAAFWLSLPLGTFIAAFLWVNEFPDYRADVEASKKNLVVRLGRLRASRLLPVFYAAGFLVLVALPLAGHPVTVLFGLAALPPAVYASLRTWQHPESFYRHYNVQPAALFAFMLYALGAGGGYLLSSIGN